MPTKYAHTNIISENWESLTKFYIEVFDCKPVPPQRNQSGEWLEKGTGVKNASLKGMHLRLPGHGESGPTLEIYSYGNMIEKPEIPAANRKGFGHLAFEVDNVEETLGKMLKFGGSKLGEIVVKEVEGVGTITFTYATDPEGNIIEIQNWKYR
ncbi:MAG: VOC family protein [Bacteroidales bacterium]|nr:VOC family protein [Bacteroidales bacterium]